MNVIETLRTTTPLVNQVLLNWLTESYIYVRLNDEQRQEFGLKQPKGIGYGIGLAFAVFAMQGKYASITPRSFSCSHHFLVIASMQRQPVWYAVVYLAYSIALISSIHRCKTTPINVNPFLSPSPLTLLIFRNSGHAKRSPRSNICMYSSSLSPLPPPPSRQSWSHMFTKYNH